MHAHASETSKTERVHVAATKARPATDEPVTHSATKSPVKKAPAKTSNGAPAKRATKTARAAKPESATAGTDAATGVKRAPRAKAADAPGTRAKKGEVDADGLEIT